MTSVSEQQEAVFLLLNTTGTSFCGETLKGGLGCAVLVLTPTLMERIRLRGEQMLAARRMDRSLYEMFYWDSEPRFYGCDLIEVCEEEDVQAWLREFENQGYARLPPEIASRLVAGEFEPKRTECDQMALSCSPASHGGPPELSVKWVVIPKHDGIYVDTAQISLAELERLSADNIAQTR